MRNEHYAEALAAIPADDTSADASFWKGQALLHLNRLPEAALAFSVIPSESPLYPYAAKGLLYCAWQSPTLNFVELVAPLTASTHPDVAKLSLAALAEHQLRHTRSGDITTLETLKELAEQDPKLMQLVKLLHLESLRRQGKFDEALQYGRTLEADKDLSPLMRQRIRLAISDVYYDKEAVQEGTELQEGDIDDEGRGEETLLQFISANPDSQLLEEAFRRLDEKEAFTTSEYALAKLREWSQSQEQSRRATLALLALQRLRIQSEPDTKDATYANTAHALFPHEPGTRIILQERIRDLLSKSRKDEAQLYLNMLQPADDARTRFFHAWLLSDTDKHAAKDEFLRCADIASTDVRPIALANAMICAHEIGDEFTIRQIFSLPLLPSARRLLLITHAELILTRNPEQARQELDEALTLSPTPLQMADIDMALAQIELLSSPEESLKRLSNYPPEKRKLWSDERILRLFALRMQACNRIDQKQGSTTLSSSLSLLEEALAGNLKPGIRLILTSALAEKLSTAGQHTQALQLLEGLLPNMTFGTEKARIMMLAAREAEQLGSLSSLHKAISLYEDAAHMDTPLKNRALARMAAILSWTNQGDKAKKTLYAILRNKDKLTTEELAHTYTVMADMWALDSAPDSRSKALEYCENIGKLEGISEQWKTRALLQHATFCSRYNMHDSALADYLRILATCPATGPDPGEDEWYILYAAGAGAINEHLQLQHHEEAAQLAERIATWPGTFGEQDTVGPQAKRFSEWAESIRRIHYLKPAKR